MDLEERLQQWLDDHGFQGSVAFSFSFFLLQLIFWLVIACGITGRFSDERQWSRLVMYCNGPNWLAAIGVLAAGLSGGRLKATLLGGIWPPSIRTDWLVTPVEQSSGDDYAFRAVKSEICVIHADPF